MSKVVIITGGFGNLAAAVARRFAADGWQVALIDRGSKGRPEVEQEFVAHLLRGGVDITDFAAATKASTSG